jgi:hypothetical protein
MGAATAFPGIEGVPYLNPEPQIDKFAGVSNDFLVGFTQMQKAVHQTAVEHGWWEKLRVDGELIALMHSAQSYQKH